MSEIVLIKQKQLKIFVFQHISSIKVLPEECEIHIKLAF